MDSQDPDETPADEDRGAVLMAAWQGGDESAFEALVEAYSGRVWALCTRFLGPVPGREDLVQDAFLRIVRARDRYRPTARFSTWLYRIVFNLCANVRERRRPALSLEGGALGGEDGESWDVEDAGARAPEQGLDALDVSSAVRAAIAELPDAQRMALILAKYEDLPYAEIAVVLDSTEKAIKSLIHRARESLRAKLAPWLEEERL